MKIIRIIDSKEMDDIEYNLRNDDHYNYKGPSSFLSHLKSSLYDWRIEEQWGKSNSYVFSIDMKSFIFFTFTKKFKKNHCTLRHIFVEENSRNKKYATMLYQHMISVMKNNDIDILRMFINIPAIDFYKKQGIKQYHGYSKTGLPFYYGKTDGTLIKLPDNQLRYVHSKLNKINLTVDLFDGKL